MSSCEATRWDDAGPELTGWLLERLPCLEHASRKHDGPLIVISDHMYPEFDGLLPAVLNRLNQCHDKSVTIHHEEMGKFITLWYDLVGITL